MPIQPTLDTEIEILTQAIASKRDHISRQEYIAIVQPLKDSLADKIEQNEIIKAENAALIAAELPTAEELESKRDENIAAEIAIKYPLPAEMALRWKLRVGKLTMESPEIIAYMSWIESSKAKYPKV